MKGNGWVCRKCGTKENAPCDLVSDWCWFGRCVHVMRKRVWGEGGAVRQSRQRCIERKREEEEEDRGGGGERGSGREFAVNNEKRLPRCAPGKAKPQPVLKLWHRKNAFNRFTAAFKERDAVVEVAEESLKQNTAASWRFRRLIDELVEKPPALD